MTTLREITDEEVLAKYPDIAIDHDSKDYWKGCLQNKLVLKRCQDCGYYIHLPRPSCPRCWSNKVAPVQMSGRGTVHLLVFYHQGRFPQSPGTPAEPYPIAVVELPEQLKLRITATLVNCSKDDMRIGMPVELTWIDHKGAPVPAFQPLKKGK